MMKNKYDFNELSKKLNLQGIVDNLKSIISPLGQTPSPQEGDIIGMQLAQLSLLIQEMAEVHAEQAQRLAKVNKLFNQVFDQLQARQQEEKEKASASAEISDIKSEASNELVGGSSQEQEKLSDKVD